MGPKWENGKKLYTKHRELSDKKQLLLRELEKSNRITQEITARIEFLTANEFVANNALTQKGVLDVTTKKGDEDFLEDGHLVKTT